MSVVVHLVMRNHPLAEHHPLAADTLAQLTEWSRNRRGSELEVAPGPHFSDVRVRFASSTMARSFLSTVQTAMPDVVGEVRSEAVKTSAAREATERMQGFIQGLPLHLASDLESADEEELEAAASILDRQRAGVARRI